VPRRRRLLPALAAALAVLLPLPGCGTVREGEPATPAAAPSVSRGFDAADVTFVRTLVPHHRQGIEIARIAAERSARPHVKILAEAIVATQEDETVRLAGWLRSWQQPAITGSAAPASSERRIAALRKVAGRDVDRRVLTLLIAHQQEAVAIAQAESRAGRNINALAFAEQIQRSRPAEIDQMRAYLDGPAAP
jgi:uncharacterized protein (DUF305 family)